MAPDLAPERAEIDAYVDGRLGPRERVAVQDWLARHPEAAAGVMADLRLRDELRLAFAAPLGAPTPATLAAGRRLAAGLRADRRAPRLARIAALAAIFAFGWLAHAGLGPLSVGGLSAAPPPPAWLTAALEAHRTSELRAGMASQRPSTLDRAEIRAGTGLYLPAIPEDWRLRDAQIFPSSLGPSLEAAFDAPEGALTLFAVRPGSFAVRRPATFAAADLTAAHFQIGDAAYVLVGPAGTGGIERLAGRLFDSLH